MQEAMIRSKMVALEEKATTFRKSTTIVLQGNSEQAYLRQLQGELEKQGMQVQIQDSCDNARYIVRVEEEHRPQEGPMGGVLHELRLLSSIQHCVSLSNPEPKERRTVVLGVYSGYHSSDPMIAQQDAWDKIQPAMLLVGYNEIFPLIKPHF